MTTQGLCQINYKNADKAKEAFAELLLKGYVVEQRIKYSFTIPHEGCEFLKKINLQPDQEKKL